MSTQRRRVAGLVVAASGVLKRLTLLAAAAGLAALTALSPATAETRGVRNGPIVFQAFVGTARPAPTELFTIHPDGTGPRQITQIPGNDESNAEFPNWAPHSAKII